jgi:hypothetical protein
MDLKEYITAQRFQDHAEKVFNRGFIGIVPPVLTLGILNVELTTVLGTASAFIFPPVLMWIWHNQIGEMDYRTALTELKSSFVIWLEIVFLNGLLLTTYIGIKLWDFISYFIRDEE